MYCKNCYETIPSDATSDLCDSCDKLINTMAGMEVLQRLVIEAQTGGGYMIFDPESNNDCEAPSIAVIGLAKRALKEYHDLKFSPTDHEKAE